MVVVDASVVVAALVDSGSTGRWAEEILGCSNLVAPHSMPVDAANILRRAALVSEISADGASLALADLLDLQVDLFPFAPFAERVWELRTSLTASDAWYVALAEIVGAPLATLDVKLSRAMGPRCTFILPPR